MRILPQVLHIANAMSNQVSAADLLSWLYSLIHDEFPPIEETRLHLRYIMFPQI
jgi:hypothetical protein